MKGKIHPREYRNTDDIPLEWKERLARKACPICDKPRADFDGRHRGTPCCSKACSETYWSRMGTWSGIRYKIFKASDGKCRKCGKKLTNPHRIYNNPFAFGEPKEYRIIEIPESFIVDHIIPIAIGGPQWDPTNLQILCPDCNKEKTAQDAKTIAEYRRTGKIAKHKPLTAFGEGSAC